MKLQSYDQPERASLLPPRHTAGFFRCMPAVFVLFLYCALGASASMADDTGGDTSDIADFMIPPSIDSPHDFLFRDSAVVPERLYSVPKAAVYSALVPGAGQLYCGHPLYGGMFTLAITIAGLYANNRYANMQAVQENVDLFARKKAQYRDSMHLSKTLYETYMGFSFDYEHARYRKKQSRYSFHHASSGLMGLYLWNVAGALEQTNVFKHTQPRKPLTAFCLSLIPFAGLGQLYNGALGKAGRMWTFQTTLAYVGYHYNKCMQRCEQERNKVLAEAAISQSLREAYDSRWRGEWNDAFKQRNIYLWTFVIFYAYSIADAVIDAHLNDYVDKIRIEPSVSGQSASVSVRLNIPTPF